MIEHADPMRYTPAALAPGVVHLWTATLPLDADQLARCESTLSADERRRAAQRRVAEDRANFVSVRGVLRRLLATYCGHSAETLKITYAPTGKPFLGEPGMGIEFNVAHAGSLALLAFSRGAAVGVDVERVRHVRRAEKIAERIMTPSDFAAWRALPAGERITAFIREWTRLEALSKLTGEGVWKTLMDRTVSPDEPVSWFDLAPAPGYLGTLAIAPGPVRVLHYEWPRRVGGTSDLSGGLP